MFGTKDQDLRNTLSAMEQEAREQSQFNQLVAREKFKERLAQDRRFDPYDKDALVRRVQDCKAHGAVLDLNDPRLRGDEARPLDRSQW
jgi:hypothetical protein